MIGPTGAVHVIIGKPVDIRKGAEGLAALVHESTGADPFSGAVYVFRARRADRIKQVHFDGTACACSRRGWKTASSSGLPSPTAWYGSHLRSFKRCSKASTGGSCTSGARRFGCAESSGATTQPWLTLP